MAPSIAVRICSIKSPILAMKRCDYCLLRLRQSLSLPVSASVYPCVFACVSIGTYDNTRRVRKGSAMNDLAADKLARFPLDRASLTFDERE